MKIIILIVIFKSKSPSVPTYTMAFSDQGEKFGPVCTVLRVRAEKKIEFTLSDRPSPNIPYIKYITRSFRVQSNVPEVKIKMMLFSKRS